MRGITSGVTAGDIMRSQSYFLLALLLLVPLTPLVEPVESTSARSQPCSGAICINEALPNPNGGDDAMYPGGEWLEIFNSGTTDVDVRNWYFSNKGAKTLTFDANSIVGYDINNASTYTISPGDYMVIARNGYTNFYVANSNDFMTLYDGSGNWIDEATWNSSSSGVSLEQDPSDPYADWIATSNPTPGSSNTGSGSAGPTYFPSDLQINEIMADSWPSRDNASWPGGEWIELHNNGTSTINMSGWWLQDQAGNMIEIDSSHLIGATSDYETQLIYPGEIRTVAVNATMSSGVLNNGQETVRLYLPNGSIGDEVSWNNNEPGFSLEENPLGGMWVISTYPSPNSTNIQTLDSITASGSVGFNEIMPVSNNDGNALPLGEWIELLNTGTSDIDLNGWSIIDGMGNQTFLDPGTIAVNSTQGSTTILSGERRIVEFTADTRLWDNYNHLILLDASSNVVDMAWYATNYGPNVSLLRSTNYNDAWSPSLYPTPGQPEPVPAATTGDVRITELLPDAVGLDSESYPGGEWIEIHNFGTSEVDVAGWRLSAANRNLMLHQYNMPMKSTTILAAGETTLVALNGTSQFYLKHTTPDQINLIDGNGAIAHSAQWTSTLEGGSLINNTETHAGAGQAGTNAPTTSTTWGMDDWVNSAWATPGTLNPVWPEYTDSESIIITEIASSCDDSEFSPSADWIELHNTGTEPVNLSRWMVSVDYTSNPLMGRQFVDSSMLWSHAENNTTIEAGQRIVVELTYDIFGGSLEDTGILEILNPDGELVTSASPPSEYLASNCVTYGYNETNSEWVEFAWPTPGTAEPDATMIASQDSIKFTSVMWDGISSISTELEFFEITNNGEESATLNGWQIRRTAADNTEYTAVITNLQIDAGSSVKLTNDVSGLGLYEDGTIIDMNTAMSTPIYLLDSGMALQLIHPTGQVADTIVYGNGPVDAEGWSGVALSEPVNGIDNLILYRGDGCGTITDTNQSVDWHQRWGRLGASDFCTDLTFSDATMIQPLLGPHDGLVDVLAWVNQAQTSLHLHLYQLQSMDLTQALIDAHDRGVTVVVVLNEVESWWNTNDRETQASYAYELKQAGIDVSWFGGSGDDPYLYLHAKVAVQDESSVWIGSGNWKDASLPPPGQRGNRDWSMIVHSQELAQTVLEHMAFDEDSMYVSQVSSTPPTNSYSMPEVRTIVGDSAPTFTGTYSGTLLTCPDDCVEGLTNMIENADEEILLSLQYLDLDWQWGWGENPVVSALEDAAQRDVSIRLIINGAYLDEDIQDIVDRMNNDWNQTNGWDVSAIIMSEDDDVSKLHNKGAIVDGTSVLISSINWGDSAMVRNREMGLIIDSAEIATPYITSWYADWNRLDNVTDTDNDGMPDIWEVGNGLNRTIAMFGSTLEGDMDVDGDTLSNYDEYLLGGNPLSTDTDGDCILDQIEVAWAQTTALDPGVDDVSPKDAINMADADGDGINEADALGCDLGGITPEPADGETNNTENQSIDDDGDGVLNGDDDCPDTLPDTSTDISGCSLAQLNQNAGGSSGEAEKGMGEIFMLLLMLGGALLLIGAANGIIQNRKNKSEVKDWIEEEELNAVVGSNAGWDQPVLDGQAPDAESGLSAQDLGRFPGWDEAMVEKYLDMGWSLDQLDEYYQQQMSEQV